VADQVKLWLYRLPSVSREGWGVIVINSLGFFGAVSDYGNYAYGWPNHGECDFRVFVAALARDPDYVQRKLSLEHGWPVDVPASVKAVREAVLEARRGRSRQLTKAGARDLWDELDSVYDEHELTSVIDCAPLDDKGELFQHSPPASLVAFTTLLLPRLSVLLRAELEAEQAAQSEASLREVAVPR
jgi:hypothetical protein